MLLLLSAVALVYTTPWDNYLVATRVWWYNSDLVLGIILGWVPLEEYAFFVLQPILTGLWVLYWGRRLSLSHGLAVTSPRLRWVTTLVGGLVWLGVGAILVAGWQPGTYMALEVGWMVPPILLQLSFGADILWHQRRWISFSLASATLYYSLADALAISAGTWTIDPAQSLPILLGGVLPLEEFVFFFLTNTLIVFGVVLMLSMESHDRIRHMMQSLSRQGWIPPLIAVKSETTEPISQPAKET